MSHLCDFCLFGAGCDVYDFCIVDRGGRITVINVCSVCDTRLLLLLGLVLVISVMSV